MFSTKKISENITCITDIAGTHMYLVEGKNRALLIDTGIGVGSLN